MVRHYFLDTNIISDLMRNPGGEVAHKISSLSTEERELISTSVIVACELRFRAAKKRFAVFEERLTAFHQSLAPSIWGLHHRNSMKKTAALNENAQAPASHH
jgi:predicted nucleic acid-binding protein